MSLYLCMKFMDYSSVDFVKTQGITGTKLVFGKCLQIHDLEIYPKSHQTTNPDSPNYCVVEWLCSRLELACSRLLYLDSDSFRIGIIGVNIPICYFLSSIH